MTQDTEQTDLAVTVSIGGDLTVGRIGYGAMQLTGPKVWGETALTEFVEPMITVRVTGAVPAVLPTTSWRPAGLDAKVRFTVCGSSWMLSTSVSPPASVAVRRSSRCDGYS